MSRPTFNLLEGPLEGSHLIEAHAGTGKTYTISALFVRLLLEGPLEVEQIAVVTYTEAAAEELKGRIRQAIRAGLEAFETGKSPDPFLASLACRHPDRARGVKDLERALLAFDLANITTLHGFCLHVLQDQAFETGQPFEAEVFPEQGEIVTEVVHDFFRRHFYEASHAFLHHALRGKNGVAVLERLLSLALAHPHARVVPQAHIRDCRGPEEALEEALVSAREIFEAQGVEVRRILETYPFFHGRTYGPERVRRLLGDLERLLRASKVNLQRVLNLAPLSASALGKGTRGGREPPRHPFFGVWEEALLQGEALSACLQEQWVGLQSHMMAWGPRELRQRKEARALLSFDDLLMRVEEALQGPGGEAVARRVRRNFRAALVDEFQDTDPVQYGIFRRFFGAPPQILFMVGDPKQAIYAFRGADLFAYLRAVQEVPSLHTLRGNWRSEERLLRGLDALFGGHPLPFLHEGIEYEANIPAQGRPAPFRMDGQNAAGLEVWFWRSEAVEEKGRPLAVGRATAMVARAVAAKIRRLLQGAREGRVTLGEKPLGMQDVAVLVRTHREAGHIQRALSSLGIPSVRYSQENLLDSEEALEMEYLLGALVLPGDEERILKALATRILGLGAAEIHRLCRDPSAWEARIQTFHEDHERWRQEGFWGMMYRLLEREGVLSRLMGLPHGERKVTNLFHLMEVLHQVASAEALSPRGLFEYLRRQRLGPRRLEEHELRLESDEDAVRVVTVHRSKGLQYPVVFCPFAWHGLRTLNRDEPLLYHDPEGELVVDLGSETREEAAQVARAERLSEDLRILYVALTRACSRCYLTWGHFRGAGTSPLFYLLSRERPPRGADPVQFLEARYKALTGAQLLEELREALGGREGVVRIREMPEPAGAEDLAPLPGPPRLEAPQFRGEIRRTWQVVSFSSLVSGRAEDAETPDRAPWEEREDAADHAEAAEGILGFPRGIRAGNLLHELLEHLDLSAQDRSLWEGRVEQGLWDYGLDPGWKGPLLDLMGRLSKLSLDPDLPGLCLGRIPSEQRVHEMGFYFPLGEVTPSDLARAFGPLEGGHGSFSGVRERLGRLGFQPTRGFMKGYMDLVFAFEGRFFVLDWKSNFLGPSWEDYGPERLALEMMRHDYVLQYHLYTLALHLHLLDRIQGYRYASHFGGVYYLFLRGIGPGTKAGHGIFRDRPSPERILTLARALLPEGHPAREEAAYGPVAS